MPSIKYDNTDVETGGGGEHAQPGMYAGKIVSVTHRTTKSDGSPGNDLEVVVDLGPEYRRLWSYIGLGGAAAWKMREFTDAVGLPPKGELTVQKLKALANTKVNVKVAADTDLDGEYRGKVKNLFKPGEGGAVTESAASANSGGEGYEGMSIEDLTAEIEDRGLELPTGRKTVAKLVTLLEEDDEAASSDGNEPEVEAAADDDEPPTDDYDEWPEQDLKDEIEERGATGNLPAGRKTKAVLISFLRDLDGAPMGADPDVPPEDEYDEWDDDDLKAELADRNEQGAEIKIAGRVTRDKIITALREDNANAAPF